MKSKQQLLLEGESHIKRWCGLNKVVSPEIRTYVGSDTDFGTCAYYRDSVIHIWPKACAGISVSGRSWSYPGYCVDRTPYGVLAHELGHHVEQAHGSRGGIVAKTWREETREEPLTTYCPNDNEWFAEIFRLFITNPDLLRLVRPLTYLKLIERWSILAETRDWESVIPEEIYIQAAKNRIRKAERVSRQKQLSFSI